MHSNDKLAVQAITKFCAGALLVGVLLFLPAGTLDYWQGWLLMAILFVPLIILRIRNEEKVLENELDGYLDYEQKVAWKLVPHVW